MPVMDGYTASREIRGQEKFQSLPVIAMTANAMVGDREKALAAGMNDHIAKPLNVVDMFATMAKWITPSRPGEVPVPAGSAGEESDALPTIAGVDVTRGLATCGGKATLYRKLVLKFLESYTGFGQAFSEALLGADETAPERLAHTLKGVAANIGAMELSSEAAQLENACRGQVPDDEIQAILALLEDRLGQVLEAVAAAGIVPEASVVNTGPVMDQAQMQPLLDSLREALNDCSIDALSIAEELSAGLGDPSQAQQLAEIRESLDAYDFDQALEQFASLEAALLGRED
jgi:CheY-like chemotaxis protein